MQLRPGRAILVAALAATAGCAAPPARTPAAATTRDEPSAALLSPNLRLLAERRGVELDAEDLARRNDPPISQASTEAPRETWVLRDVRDRQDVVGGRTRSDSRQTTRIREWWQY
jgi:hypothetical protein